MVYEDGKRGFTSEGTMNNLNKVVRQGEDLMSALIDNKFPLKTIGDKKDVQDIIELMIKSIEGARNYLDSYQTISAKHTGMTSIKPNIVKAYHRKAHNLVVGLTHILEDVKKRKA